MIKSHLDSCFHNIIQMEFIFNTFSITMLEICVLYLNLNKRIEKTIICIIVGNVTSYLSIF
jgi:hypothetical protein